jgi:multiple sugar transport system substrate-binding protein
VFAVLLTITLVAGACGPAEPPDEPTASPDEPEGPVTVDLWFHSGRSEERDALLSSFDEEFEAEYPNINIELVELPEGSYNDQVQSAAVAGELPCVLDFDGPFVYNYVWGGFLIPIDEYFTEEELDDFLPSIIAQGTYQDGQLYSLGQYDSGLAIWAQGPVLEAAGVRIPTVDDPWSREEFEDAMAAVLEVEGIEYALDMKMNYAPSAPSEWLTYGFSPILQSFGADLIDRETYQTAEGVLNGPEAVEAMSMIQSWFENGYANPNPADDACFTSGACAMSWVGHWTANAHIEAYGDDLLLLPVPDFGNGAKTGMGSWNWGITSQCANPDAAATVLRYLVSSESILAMTELNGAVPARFSAMDQNELYAEGGLLSLYTDQIAAGYAVPRPITAAYPTITAAFSTAFRNIANGADVQDELDNAVDTIDADLEDNDFYQ